MSAVLGVTVLVYALGIAAVCAVSAAAGRLRPRAVVPALAILECAVVVQAVTDAVQVFRQHHGTGLGVHLAYVHTALVILPATAVAVRLDPGRWGSVGLAVGCLVLVAVSLRMHQTYGAVRG